MTTPVRSSHRRIKIGPIWIDSLTRTQALSCISELVETRRGGTVFTPNVDHVLTAETNAEFSRAYDNASLVLADGVPVVWASRLLGTPLPEKLSGSDMVLPIAQLAASKHWRVYLLGGNPGVGKRAAERLSTEYGVNIVGVDDPIIRLETTEPNDGTLARIRAARPNLLFVALGSPKQELWITRHRAELNGTLAIGVGASLDFIAGTVQRAPAWVSAIGLEWLYRLAQEPRRLWRRYLVRSPRFVGVVLRALRTDLRERVR